MTDMPETIWASQVALFDSGRSAGSYYTDRYSSPAGNDYATEYRRADLPPTLAQALKVPEVAEMVDGFRQIETAALGGSLSPALVAEVTLATLAAIEAAMKEGG